MLGEIFINEIKKKLEIKIIQKRLYIEGKERKKKK